MNEFTAEEIALFDADAAEAEAGYSTEFLDSRRKLRLRGRPPLADKASVMVRLRIDPDQLRRLDDQAKAEHTTRSQYIRNAIDHQLTAA